MKILTVGGGSGGHIIPVVAVVEKLHQLAPEAEIRFWCDRKSLKMAREAFAGQSVAIKSISAGKFRRYHHFSWWQHLRPSIVIPNLIDLFKIVGGFIQSWWRLLIWRPDVVFAKGGFVCLPVGIVAHWLGIKLIIHDSDTVAGLTNRILSKYAVKITTGMPVEYYRYPTDKTVFVGSPVRQGGGSVADLRAELHISPKKLVILVSGGGLGSDFLNRMTLANLERLPENCQVILSAGRGNYQAVMNQKFDKNTLIVRDFVTNFADYVRLADVVVARAGATTIAELAVLAKPVILVPNPKLVEGHQLKNAQMLADKQAAVVLDEFALEQVPEQFGRAINELLDNQHQREMLSRNIQQFANPQSALTLAELIIAEIQGGEGERG
jgi:UDP-N-acetylglucosamine--N-acetylmuramyl-(pentapeptide) pyrophosphoryl-undecaprenol N-acetylglucosamine transferase